MKIEFTKEEIFKAWEEIVDYAAQDAGADYPEHSIILIKKVLETLAHG